MCGHVGLKVSIAFRSSSQCCERNSFEYTKRVYSATSGQQCVCDQECKQLQADCCKERAPHKIKKFSAGTHATRTNFIRKSNCMHKVKFAFDNGALADDVSDMTFAPVRSYQHCVGGSPEACVSSAVLVNNNDSNRTCCSHGNVQFCCKLRREGLQGCGNWGKPLCSRRLSLRALRRRHSVLNCPAEVPCRLGEVCCLVLLQGRHSSAGIRSDTNENSQMPDWNCPVGRCRFQKCSCLKQTQGPVSSSVTRPRSY